MQVIKENWKWLAPLALVFGAVAVWVGKPEWFYDRVELLDSAQLSDMESSGLLYHTLQADDLSTVQAHADEGLGQAQLVLGICYEAGHEGCGYDPGKAAQLYTSAADAGVARAWERLCNLHLFGLGVEQDGAAARNACTKGMEQGDRASKARLAELDLRHFGSMEDRDAQARGTLEELAEAGNVPAMQSLALAYSSRLLQTSDRDAAVNRWQTRARDAGSLAALDHTVRRQFGQATSDEDKRAALAPLENPQIRAFPVLATVLGELTARLDKQRGREIIVAAGETGHPRALAHKAYLLREDRYAGGEGDTETEIKLARQSANEGDTFGAILLEGAENGASADEHLQIAKRIADQGLPSGELAYARRLRAKSSLQKAEVTELQILLERNARRGFDSARSDVAELYTNGKHVPVDLARARRLRTEFAADGHQPSRRELANMMLDGKGGPVDLDGAIRLMAGATEYRERMSLARAYKKRNKQGDGDKALAIYEDLGRQGHVRAMEQAALHHSFVGNYSEADRWFWEALKKATPEQTKTLRMSMVVHELTKSFRNRSSSRRTASSSGRSAERVRSPGRGMCTSGANWARCDANATLCRTSRDGNDVACGGMATLCQTSRNGNDAACGGQSTMCRTSRDGNDVACGGQSTMCRTSRNGNDVACGGLATTCSTSRDGYRAACGGRATTCRTPRNNRSARVCGGRGRYSGD